MDYVPARMNRRYSFHERQRMFAADDDTLGFLKYESPLIQF
jgi:hypothetical protein